MPTPRPIAAIAALGAALAACTGPTPQPAATPSPSAALAPSAETLESPAPPPVPPEVAPDARVTRGAGLSPLRVLSASAQIGDEPSGAAQIRFELSAPIDPASFDPATDLRVEPPTPIDWTWPGPRTLLGTTHGRRLAPSVVEVELQAASLIDSNGRTLERGDTARLERPAPTVRTELLDDRVSTADEDLTPHDELRPVVGADDLGFVLPLDQPDVDLDALTARLILQQTPRMWTAIEQPLTRDACAWTPVRAGVWPLCQTTVQRAEGQPEPLDTTLREVPCPLDLADAPTCVELRATEMAAPGARITPLLDGAPLHAVGDQEQRLEVAVAEPFEIVSVHCKDTPHCHEGAGVEIVFSAPLAVDDQGLPRVTIEVDDQPMASTWLSWSADRPGYVSLYPNLPLGKQPTVTVSATDVRGREISRGERRLTIGEVPDHLEIEHDLLTIDRRSPHLLVGEAESHQHIELSMARVDPDDLTRVAAWLEGPRDTPLGQIVELAPFDVTPSEWRRREIGLPLDTLVGPDDGGAVAFEAGSDTSATHHGLVVFTSLALTAHAAHNGTRVLLTDLGTAATVGGAEIALVDAEGTRLHTARTTMTGTASLPGRAELGLDSNTPLWLQAARPDDPTNVALLRLPDLASIDARVSLAGVVRADRTLYAPGQTVRLAGQLRTWSLDGPAALGELPLEIALRKTFPEAELAVQPLDPAWIADDGTLDARFELPVALEPGDHDLVVRPRDEASAGALETRLWIAPETRAAVDLDLVAPTLRVVHGDALELSISARSLVGASLAGQTVRYTVHALRSIARWPDCRSCALDPGFDESFEATGSVALDADGRAVLALDPWIEQTASLVDLEVTVEIDADDETVTDQVRITVDPAPFYLRMSRSPGSVYVGDRVDVDVCTVGVDGQPWREPLDRAAAITTEVDSPQGVTTRGAACLPAADDHCVRCPVDLTAEYGDWTVRAQHADWPNGEALLRIFAANRFPASQAMETEWTRITAPGDLTDDVTVRLLRQARHALISSGAWTLQRSFAIELEPHQPASLRWTPTLLDVPSSDLVVTAIDERRTWELDSGGRDHGRPTSSTDSDTVDIPVDGFELDVALDVPTSWSSASPMPIALEVTDGAGAPVTGARVSLWVVDASTERLQRDATAELHDGLLRASSESVVVHADTRDTMADRIGFTSPQTGYMSSRSGHGRVGYAHAGQRRPRWLPTHLDAPAAEPLLWQPLLTTDDGGAVHAEVELPLGVERVTVRAMVASELVHFGEVRAQVDVTRPVVARLDAPATLGPADRAEARVWTSQAVTLTQGDWATSSTGEAVLDVSASEARPLQASLAGDEVGFLPLPTVPPTAPTAAPIAGLEVTRYLETPAGDALDADVLVLSPGDVVRVTLAVTADRTQLAGALQLIDHLPAGLEWIDARWQGAPAPGPVASGAEVVTGPRQLEVAIDAQTSYAIVTGHAIAVHAGHYHAPAMRVTGESVSGALGGHWSVSVER